MKDLLKESWDYINYIFDKIKRENPFINVRFSPEDNKDLLI